MTDNELDQYLLEAFDARVPSPERLRERLPAPEIGRSSPWWLALVAAAVLLVVAVPSLSPRGSPGAPAEMRVVTVTLDPRQVTAGWLAPGDRLELYALTPTQALPRLPAHVLGTDPEGRLTVSLSREDALLLTQSEVPGEVWPVESADGKKLLAVPIQGFLGQEAPLLRSLAGEQVELWSGGELAQFLAEVRVIGAADGGMLRVEAASWHVPTLVQAASQGPLLIRP